MLKVDLNSDLGESFGNYTLGLRRRRCSNMSLPPISPAAGMRVTRW